MGIIQIKGPQESPTITKAIHLSCWIKKKWSDSWEICPYYEPVSAVEAIAPSMPRAEFLYHYGKIKREDLTSFNDWAPESNEEYYIQIRSINAKGSHVLWTGIITDDEYNMYGASIVDEPAGVQTVIAYGMEHLLDRRSIIGAFCEEAGETVKIGWTPIFNERHHRGASLLGNRSTSIDSNGVYVFSKDGKVWSHLDIAEYLLKFYHPEGITFELGGQFIVLNEIKTIQRFEGLTIRQALNKLIDRRRGLGWCIRTKGSGIVTIHVFSVFENPVSVGDVTLPPNYEQQYMVFDDNIDIQEALIKLSTSSCYDKIIVQGARIKSCFTISFTDGTLEEAWTSEEETAYKAGDSSEDTNPAKNDAERKTDKFDRVYQSFRIPTDWDWKAGNGIGGDKSNAAPGIDKNGNLDINKSQSIWNFARAFLRDLPIEKPADKDDAEPEFLAPLIFVKNPADNKYYQIDKIDPVNKNPGQIRMLDREMGIEIKIKTNHLLGLNHFDPETDKPTGIQPEIDYETIIATVFAETDERIKVEVDVPKNQQSASLKTLVIDVEDAELWYVVPGTVVKTKNGELQYDSGGIVRDDSGRLRTIAALAKAWYGQKRAAVGLTIKNIAEYSPVGVFIISASSSWHEEQVGTVVSQRTWDFRNATTHIETGFFELDISAIVDIPNMSDLRAVSRAFHKQQKEITDLKQHVGNLPVRIPVGIPTEIKEEEQMVDNFIDDFNRDDSDDLNGKYLNGEYGSIRNNKGYPRSYHSCLFCTPAYILSSPNHILKVKLYLNDTPLYMVSQSEYDAIHSVSAPDGYPPVNVGDLLWDLGERSEAWAWETKIKSSKRTTLILRSHKTGNSNTFLAVEIIAPLIWRIGDASPLYSFCRWRCNNNVLLMYQKYHPTEEYWERGCWGAKWEHHYGVFPGISGLPGIEHRLDWHIIVQKKWADGSIQAIDEVYIPETNWGKREFEVASHIYDDKIDVFLEDNLIISVTQDMLVDGNRFGLGAGLTGLKTDHWQYKGVAWQEWKAWIDTVEEPKFDWEE